MKVRTKFIVTATLLAAILSSVFVFYIVASQTQVEMKRLNEKINWVNELVVLVNIEPLWNLSEKIIERNVAIFQKDPEISRIRISDGNFVHIEKRDEDYLSYGSDIKKKISIVKGEDKLGFAEVVYSTASLEKKIEDLRNRIILGIIGLIVVAILITILAGKIFLRPIEKIKRFFAEIEEDNLEATLEISSKDEFQEIGLSITALAEEKKALVSLLEERSRELTKLEKSFSDIFDNAIEGIFKITLDGKMVSANQALADILQYSSSKDIEESILDVRKQLFITLDHADALLNYFEKEQRALNNFECQLYRRDKSTVWVSIQAHAVRNNQGLPTHIIGLVSDIGSRKQSEDEMNTIYSALEKTVSEKTIELKHTEERLEELSQKVSSLEKNAAIGELLSDIVFHLDSPFVKGLLEVKNVARKAQNINELFRSGKLRKTDFSDFISGVLETSESLQFKLNVISKFFKKFQEDLDQIQSGVITEVNIVSELNKVVSNNTLSLKTRIVAPERVVFYAKPGLVEKVFSHIVSFCLNYGANDTEIIFEIKQENSEINILFDWQIGLMDEKLSEQLFSPFICVGDSVNIGDLHLARYIIDKSLQGKCESNVESTGLKLRISLPVFQV